MNDLLLRIPDKFFTYSYLTGFGIVLFAELLALLRSLPGDTFSEKVYGFLDAGPARYLLVGGTLLWLTIHLLFRGRLG